MHDEFYLIKEPPVGRRQVALAQVVVVLLLLAAVIVTPLASHPLLPLPGYMSAFGFAMIVVNIILGALLYAKGMIENKQRMIRLGTAYFFVTIIFIPLIAAFPGALMSESIIGSAASAVWLWSYWHIGFGLLIIRYARSSDDGSGRNDSIWASVAAVLIVVALLTWSATIGLPYLPQVLRDGKQFFDTSTLAIPVCVFGVNLVALLYVIRMRADRPEQLWVMTGMVAACADIWLTMYGGTRFSLGWYFAKMSSLFTSLVVLISQLYGITRLYHSIAGANQLLLTQANQDGLTSLSNRRCFERLLDLEWSRARREKSSLAMLMIDVDFFKKYNDRYGHLAGDDCLRQVAQQLLRVIKRPGDVAARYGGEEFVVILPSTDLDGAQRVGERLLANLAGAALLHADNPPSGQVTLSVGVAAMIPGVGKSASTLTRAADKALYRAKDNGRNQVCLAAAGNDDAGAPLVHPVAP